MPFLAADPDITPITNLITTWIHIGQAMVGSIGALSLPGVLVAHSRLCGASREMHSLRYAPLLLRAVASRRQ